MNKPAFQSVARSFIDQLCVLFQGDIDDTDAARQVYSTDNSIYQLIPHVILYPKNTEDLQLILRLASLEQYRKITIKARGGGTGSHGQSLNTGIVVDLSRHMNQILAIDPISRSARVQAGVLQDQLNCALKPYGLLFVPELSSSNRATIGGMINTNASGRSLRYGKTFDHVLELKTILSNGELLESAPMTMSNWLEEIKPKSSFQREIYHQLFDLSLSHHAALAHSIASSDHLISGYDFPAVFANDSFNINPLLCGSEGSLGVVAEATLSLIEIPKYRLLINIAYDQFQSALTDAQALVMLGPLSVESIDSALLDLSKSDPVWQRIALYFPELKIATQAINLVEIDGYTEAEFDLLRTQFLQYLSQDQSIRRLSISLVYGNEQIADLYSISKCWAGLQDHGFGEKQAQSCLENIVVAPGHVVKYIVELRQWLDNHGLDFAMLSHVDAGIVQVRPLLDMKQANAAQSIQSLRDQVVVLSQKYGAVIWGEQSQLLRSEAPTDFFAHSSLLIQKVKGLFDPRNQLNPGKIATPYTLPEMQRIKILQSPLRSSRDRQIDKLSWNSFGRSMHCNGNAACFNLDPNDPTCPSYKITRNHIHSPKGRATLIKEWLRRENVGEQTRLFDRQVHAALHSCLSCKSCAGDCPVKVDIADTKARFLQKYHHRYQRHIRDYLVSHLESLVPIFARISGLYNLIQQSKLLQNMQRAWIKVVDIPLFHPQAKQDLAQYGAVLLRHDLSDFIAKTPKQAVIIVQDAFTRYFDTAVFIESLQFIKSLGITPYILPYLPNGKPLQVHGFLKGFEKKRAECIKLLNQATASGLPLIGIDPAMTLVYRQEYKSHYNTEVPASDFEVLLLQEWLLHHFNEDQSIDSKYHLDQHLQSDIVNTEQTIYYLAGHCTERTQIPDSTRQWQQVFAHFDLSLEVLALGCCGMSGAYGHLAEHRHLSAGIYAQSWQAHYQRHPEHFLVTGFSCRSQIKRLDQAVVRHPIQVLNQLRFSRPQLKEKITI